jgi:hypothetical protein
MRAHLLRQLLGRDGVQVDLVTTSREGQDFLARLGSPSDRISNHFRVEFGPRHDMRFESTARRVAAYLARPERGLNDLLELNRLAAGASFVVNDSLHPALLAAAALGRPFRVVHVTGENLWEAAEQFQQLKAPVRRAYRRALAHARDNAFGRITHTLGTARADRRARSWWLPPIVAEPKPQAAHAARLAVVYLNPHYRDPAIASAVEAAVERQGFTLYGVSEIFAGRPGWIAHDSALADSIAAADVYISGAGMGALEQARAYQTPYVALLGHQPEQERNVAMRGARSAHVGHTVEDTLASLSAALEGLGDAPSRNFQLRVEGVRAVHRQWSSAFHELISSSLNNGEARHGHRRRLRNQQPEQRVG